AVAGLFDPAIPAQALPSLLLPPAVADSGLPKGSILNTHPPTSSANPVVRSAIPGTDPTISSPGAREPHTPTTDTTSPPTIASSGGLSALATVLPANSTGQSSVDLGGTAPSAGTGSVTQTPRVPASLEQTYANLPVWFEENRGQVDSSVQYVAHGYGYNLFLSPAQATLALRKSSRVGESFASAAQSKT